MAKPEADQAATSSLSTAQQLKDEPTAQDSYESTQAEIQALSKYDRGIENLRLRLLTETDTCHVEGIFELAVDTCLWRSGTEYEYLTFDEKLDAMFSQPSERLEEFQTCLVDLGWHGQQSQIEHLKGLKKRICQVRQSMSLHPDGFHVTEHTLTSDQAHAFSCLGEFAGISIIVDMEAGGD